MKIIVSDLYSAIEHPLQHLGELAKIQNACRARPSGYQFMPKYKAGFWDGYISLMHTPSQFPTGLLDIVLDVLSQRQIDVELEYLNPYPELTKVTSSTLKGVTLRDYQVEAANAMLAAGRGIAKMATNSGKTEIMAAMLKILALPSIVLITRKELMYQTAERFRQRGIQKVGIIGDGIWQPARTTVAMVQTLSKHIDEYDSMYNKVLIIDECQHLPSDQAMDVFMKIPGQYRYGFSGTPLSGDVLSDLKLIAATGVIRYELTNDFLIGEEYSAKPMIYIKIVETLESKRKSNKLLYAEAYDKLLVHNSLRNQFIKLFINEHYAKGSTALILVDRLEHGQILAELIPGSTFVHGSLSTEVRAEALDKMRSTGGIFIATPIFDEGVDVPNVDLLVLAGGGASTQKTLQRIGRGLRKKAGANRLQVLDFIDDVNKHLLLHSQQRIDLYANEGFETKLI